MAPPRILLLLLLLAGLAAPLHAALPTMLGIAASSGQIIRGIPRIGETLTANRAGQWYLDDVAISGETGGTLLVPGGVTDGQRLRCAGSNSLIIGSDVLAAYSWALRLQTQNGTVTTGSNAGTASIVSTWVDDLGTSGLTATAVASSEPTMQVSHSTRCLRFASSRMSVPTITTSGGFHLVMAWRPTATTAAQTVFASGSSSYMQIGASAVALKGEAGAAVNLSLPRPLSVNRWAILEIIVSGTNATAYVNGYTAASGGSATIAGDGFKINLIGHQGGFNYLAGDVGALMIHQGTPLPDADRAIVRRSLAQYVSDVFYVSSSGSDSNDGYTASTPFATVARARSTNPYPGDKILLARGSVFAEAGASAVTALWPWADTVPRIIFGAYGTGPKPVVKGSSPVTGWTLVTGTEYKAAIAYTPVNAFRILGTPLSESNVQKLILGTAGSLTSGQFGTSSGYVHVNIGADPSTATIEVPRVGEYGFQFTSTNSWEVQDIGIYMFEQHGLVSTNGGNQEITRCDVLYNGDDGIDISGPTSVDVTHCAIIRNGRVRQVSGGAGDGVSYHSTGGGVIGWNVIRDNEKSAISNLEGCNNTIIGNLIDGNNRAVMSLATTDTPGAQNVYYNTIIIRAKDEGVIGIRRDGTGNTATINAVNNTIISEVSAGSVGIDAADMAKNNIVTGFGTGLRDVGASGYNNVFGCTVPYSGGTAGTGAVSADPLFTDAAAGDYTLQNGSPCLATGVPGAGPVKDWDEAVPPNPPNIGAR